MKQWWAIFSAVLLAVLLGGGGLLRAKQRSEAWTRQATAIHGQITRAIADQPWDEASAGTLLLKLQAGSAHLARRPFMAEGEGLEASCAEGRRLLDAWRRHKGYGPLTDDYFARR